MKPRLKPINEQAVVLFGATSGIGLETAMQMVEKGAQVAIVGRSQDGLNEAMEQLRSHAEASRMVRGRGNGSRHPNEIDVAGVEMGGSPVSTMEDQIIALEADITNFDQVKGVAEQVVQRFGRIDTWVNVAAVSEWALFEDTSPDEFHRIIEVNLVGHAYGAMAALPYMRQQNGGALIFVSSIAGRIPVPYQSAYNASKHGILGLAETLRMEMKHTHVPVSVTAILPASVNTPLFDKARTKLGVEPDPIPPVYDVRMVGRAIMYAAQHPVRELIVGDAGYAMTFMRRLAPTLTSNYMGATGFRQQRSNEPKSAQAPDNLYHHMTGYDQANGEYAPRVRQFGMFTWFSTHPRARMALLAALMGTAGGLLGWRIVKARNRRVRSLSYQIPHQAKKVAKQARMMRKEVQKFGKVASKTAGKTAREVGMTAASLPIISNMPMFRRKTIVERTTDRMGNWLAALEGLIMALPFLRRKSMARRVADRIAFSDRRKGVAKFAVKSGKSATEFVTDRTKSATEFVTDKTKTATGFVADRGKSVTKFVSKTGRKTSDKVGDKVSDASKAVAESVPSRKELRRRLKKAADALPEREPVVVKRRTFIEKRPFGEYRETVIQKKSTKV